MLKLVQISPWESHLSIVRKTLLIERTNKDHRVYFTKWIIYNGLAHKPLSNLPSNSKILTMNSLTVFLLNFFMCFSNILILLYIFSFLRFFFIVFNKWSWNLYFLWMVTFALMSIFCILFIFDRLKTFLHCSKLECSDLM